MTTGEVMRLYENATEIARKRAREIMVLRCRIPLEGLLIVVYMQALADVADSQSAKEADGGGEKPVNTSTTDGHGCTG